MKHDFYVYFLIAFCICNLTSATESDPPNIILVMSDDQGWGDLGCYGSRLIQTPHLDRMAAEGTRFTNCYSGSAVCAPTRCVLMTGLHSGHCTRRDNRPSVGKGPYYKRPLVPLKPEDITVATVLKKAGYVTGGFGKWGLGDFDTTGAPAKHGFDEFYGYLDQVHAHNYYTDRLWDTDQYVALPENKGKSKAVWSHDLIMERALHFVEKNQNQRFFLYLPVTLPHGKYEMPSLAPYEDRAWTKNEKTHAAMVTRLDKDMGELFALLKKLNLDKNTIVFFTGDNGPNKPLLARMKSAGPFKGTKRSLNEGGIRCPMIVRWPDHVPAGRVSEFAWSHTDILATISDLAAVQDIPDTDGVSVVPTLMGKKQKPLEYIYWEFHNPFHQAIRKDHWKGIRFGLKEPVKLYDLSNDPEETRDLAAQHPELARKLADLLDGARTVSPHWPGQDTQ
ncbi:arylsulfatase [Gimesia aquarii]|uniref:Arylsulfatase n=1 Tax=Gimesia aquarii TaxID=2527964 RepID=A0A517VW72_9PLAN|nr:arylsulfatase [Gimesia aquarii]QDT97247.1 Arylsulfatase [Gimesia aquarii]